MSNPLVSIIIPNYNRETLVTQTLNSLINQMYSNWEAIVVDDGSTDNSKEVIEYLSASEPRIRFCKRSLEPKGAPNCRNQGINLAKGKYVIFLDSDDLLAPWCLEERVKFMENHSQLDFAIFPVLLFINQPGDCDTLWNVDSDKDDLLRLVACDVPWQTSSPIWQRKALDKVGIWNPNTKSWQDWEYHIRALVKELVYKKVNALPDVFYRLGSHSTITSNWQISKDVEHKLALQRLCISIDDLLKEKGKDTFLYQKLLTGNLFKLAHMISFYNSPINAIEFFQVVSQRKMTKSIIYYISSAYLYANQFLAKHKIPLLKGLLYNTVYELLIKYYFYDSSFRGKNRTLFNVKLGNTYMKEIQKKLSLHTHMNQ